MIDIAAIVVSGLLVLVGWLIGKQPSKRPTATTKRELAHTERTIEAIEEALDGATPEKDIADKWNEL